MLLPLIWILWWPELRAQSPGASRDSARSLDALLQDYAFRTFTNPRTGILYHGNVPSNLTGIEISAMRLRSGSLRTRGVKGYNEFEIPEGVVVQPYVERLVLRHMKEGPWCTQLQPMAGSFAVPDDPTARSPHPLPQLHRGRGKLAALLAEGGGGRWWAAHKVVVPGGAAVEAARSFGEPTVRS
ncbi:hypothetical protein HHK36_014156 [Tetracentron sinense]|uniref:Uncharacterized protein n=1 Tax=Tetracentron sinense TaxID=13715 RepID=A0A834Z9B1_TETSI|nr:hypothetical protein HHK36_014156 [Tetracentron sinense]